MTSPTPDLTVLDGQVQALSQQMGQLVALVSGIQQTITASTDAIEATVTQHRKAFLASIGLPDDTAGPFG